MAAGELASAQSLTRQIEEYIADHPAAAVLEDGRVLFDMRSARYAISDSHGRCLLQLWSEERNLIRTVLDVQRRAHCLRLSTRRMGAPKPQSLELVPTSDRRTPTARDAARRTYQRVLERALTRAFLGAKVDGLRSAMDLEHSFGPAYVRGRLLRGTAAEAVIGVSQAESGPIVDGILTLGLLWLDHCRQHADARRHFGGLKVVVPVGAWRTTAERMAHLNHAAAEFQLFTLDERSEELTAVDFRDIGNLDARLVHAFSAKATIERCQEGIDALFALMAPAAVDRVELRSSSSTEVGLLLHGLEFARVRRGATAHSFAGQDQITFGAGPTRRLSPLKPSPSAATSAPASLRAATLTEPTPIHSSACSPNAGLKRASALALPNFSPDFALTCSTTRFQRSPPATADSSTCSPSTATAASPSSSLRRRKISTCPCRLSTTGFASLPSMQTVSPSPATPAAAHYPPSSARATFPVRKSHRSRAAHSPCQRARPALLLPANRVGAHRRHRALAPRSKSHVPQALL